MKIKLISFKTKIVGSIVLAGILLAVLLSVSLYTYLSNRLIDEKIKEVSRFNVEQVRKNIVMLRADQQFAQLLSERTKVSEYLLDPTEDKRTELLNIFSLYAQKDDKYLALYLLDKNGQAVISTDPTFVNQDYSFRNYYKTGMEGKGSIDILLGKTSNQFGYYFSYPVFDTDKNVIGVFISKTTNKEIEYSLLESNSTLNNPVMLVDEYGVILFSNKDGRFLKSLGTLTDEERFTLNDSKKFLDREIVPLQYDIAQDVIRNKENSKTVTFKDRSDGETEILEVYKIGEYPFYLVSEVGLETIGSTITSTLFIVVGLILFMVIFSAFFLYKMILIALNPLDTLKLFAQRVAAGDLSQRIDIKTNDDFGELANTFNMMSNNLQNLYSSLDERVREQTIELTQRAEQSENQKKAILNILEDVEKEKEKSELLSRDLIKFKLALENASDQVVIADKEGIVVYGNKAIKTITGYTPEEAVGKKAGSLWKIPMPLEYYKNMWNIIKNKKQPFIDEIQNKRKNGEVYTANISISPVLDENNEVIYFVAIEHDITKEKEIDVEKTEFVSLASHQLKTPVGALNWNLEMLLSGDYGPLDTKKKEVISEMYTMNRRMNDLINSLLNVSRIEMGVFIIEPAPIDFGKLCDEVLLEMESRIKMKGHKILKKYDKDLTKIPADLKLLRIIFQNYISNAIKYTPEKGKINIRIEVKDHDIIISVSNNGEPIPERDKEKIFSKLFRASNAQEQDPDGNGLGLYIVRKIAENSGGKVWFESENGQDTVFYASFPLSGMIRKDGTKQLA